MPVSVLLGYLALILGFLLAVVLIIEILRQRQAPSAKIAWLLIIVFLPFVGVPLYLMLGGRKIRRWAQLKATLQLEERLLLPTEAAHPIDFLLRCFDLPGASTGNRISLCRTGEEAYAAVARLIGTARRSIHICMYMLGRDAVGRNILDLLAQAADRGVQVLLLLDYVGSVYVTRSMLNRVREKGGQVALFMPVLSPFRAFRANLRNHRKILIVDNAIVWAGGTNFAKQYIGPTPWRKRWRDLSFVLEGPAVGNYIEIFRSDWAFASGEVLPEAFPTPEAVGEAVVQVVPSGPDVPQDPLYDAVLSLLFAARHRLWICTPYFVPDLALLQAIRLAAHRGVDVRVIIPQRSDHWIADLARTAHLRDIQEAGGSIMLCQGSNMHAKVILVDDDVALMGSANLDLRSLHYNYEAVLLVYSKKEIQAVEKWIAGILSHSRQGVGEVGMLRDTFEGVVSMIAPLL